MSTVRVDREFGECQLYVYLNKYECIYQSWNRKLWDLFYRMKMREFNADGKNPSYSDVFVDDRIYEFDDFSKFILMNFDLRKVISLGLKMDKDVLGRFTSGVKGYTPETISFIPHEMNVFLTISYSTNASGYAGVSWKKSRCKWVAQANMDGKRKYLGLFQTAEDASDAYIEAKYSRAKVIADRYRDMIPFECDALVSIPREKYRY